MSKALRGQRALAGIVALGLALPFAVAAQQTPPGLGQAWPNAKDVSQNRAWHVYVFQLHGIKYIEVADLTGRIVSTIGTANHQDIALPMGAFPQYVSIPDQAATLPQGVVAMTSPTTVYQDNDTTITVTHTSDAGIATAAACGNPVECNTNITK